MAEVIPFKGVLYNPRKVDASLVMSPPYDIVTPEIKDELYSRSPFNVIRVDFGKDSADDTDNQNRYTRASEYLNDWLKEDVLMIDRDRLFYCYEISYSINGTGKKTRGFLGAVKLEEMGTGKIHPHEMTYSKPKSDRLNILRFCNANISPIFSLYSSTEKYASAILDKTVRESPIIEVMDSDGFSHRLWRISDKAEIEQIAKEMEEKDIFIADGHHRYETALVFQEEMKNKGMNKTGNEPFNYVLMFLSNMEDDGLTLLPTHRIVEIDSDVHIKDEIGKYFDVQKVTSGKISVAEAKEKMFNLMRSKTHSFGMYLTNADAYYILSFNDGDIDLDLPECFKKLDVTILHKIIFERLLKIDHFEYEMDPEEAVKRAKKGSFEAVFFLNPTHINDVKEVALAGHRMPPKSTYFYPKLLTGMVIYTF